MTNSALIRSTSKKWHAARRILCVRLDAMGDVLMTGPAIRAVKHASGGAHVALLTSRSGAVAARLLPEIDAIIEYESPWMKASVERHDPLSDFEMIDRLHQLEFDAAVIFTVYSQNPLPAAMLCYLAEIPLRLAHCRENPYQLLTNWLAETEPEKCFRHEVERQLDLVESVGFLATDKRMSVEILDHALDGVRKKLSRSGIDPDFSNWLVMHPGAKAASRRYPPERFAAAARELAGRHGLKIVFTGDASEEELIEQIRAAGIRDIVSLCGEIDFEEMAALMSLAPLLISNNSSPVHLASATGTPVVDLYALTNPQHTPWLVPNRVLFADVPCRFCYKSVCPETHHQCLRGVTPEQVVAAALELLTETKSNVSTVENENRWSQQMAFGAL